MKQIARIHLLTRLSFFQFPIDVESSMMRGERGGVSCTLQGRLRPFSAEGGARPDVYVGFERANYLCVLSGPFNGPPAAIGQDARKTGVTTKNIERSLQTRAESTGLILLLSNLSGVNVTYCV